MISSTMSLAEALISKSRLTETEFKLKEAACKYIEISLRAAAALLEKEANSEGLLDNEFDRPTAKDY